MKVEASHDKQDAGSNCARELYGHALVLIEQQFQIFWFVFGAFLLTETVVLGGIGAMAKEEPGLAFWASMFGLAVAIPWWTSFRYNHTFYLLRVMQARSFEPQCGVFLTEGQRLIKGETVHGVRMPRYALRLNPNKADGLLVVLFVAAFLGCAYHFCPSRNHQKISVADVANSILLPVVRRQAKAEWAGE